MPALNDPGDRLNGWKDIAAFLGKGVRTVQRWERQLGLPVHRLGGEGGEIVFAFKSEIKQWSDEQERRKPANGGSAQNALAVNRAQRDPDSAFEVPVRASPLLGRRLAMLIITAAVTLVAVLSVSRWIRAGDRQPDSWHVSGEVLSVMDQNGARLWERRFGSMFSEDAYRSNASRARTVVIQDLDDDGDREVLFGVRPQTRSGSVGLWAFNRDGSTRFLVEPKHSIQFGAQRYAGPWLFYGLFSVPEENKPPSIWATFIHGTDFPSLLLELDSSGRVKSQYWSNGYIETVTIARWRGKSVLLVGATNNETRGASLSVFDRDHVGGSAPAAVLDYGCVGCPPGRPQHFVVFPVRCIGKEAGGTAFVQQVWVDESDQLHVLVSEGQPEEGGWAASVWYLLAPDLNPVRADIGAQTRRLHHDLELQGRLDHAFGPRDERDLFPLLSWTGDRFVQLPPGEVFQ